jgi:hypothetical protein
LGSDDSGFSDNCGALIWVARKGDFITLEALDEVSTSNNYSGLKNGAFYRKDSIDIIKQKFKPLTQHFGENPQT